MYLERIVSQKRTDPNFHAAASLPWEERLEAETDVSPRRSFVGALLKKKPGEPSIIAEMKRASPSKGSFHFQGEVTGQVQAYQRGGAKAVSVLTNDAFLGRIEDLRAAREAVELPVLRKDFLLAPWELAQSKFWGADAVLLIAAILPQKTLEQMVIRARELDLEVLLEIHDHEELQRVLDLEVAPHAVGINNRNLNTFELSLETTATLAPLLPKEICRVSESGFATKHDLSRFEGTVDAFLIGESLMRSSEPEKTLLSWIKG